MQPARRACIAAGLAVLLLAGTCSTPAEAQPSDSLTFQTLPAAPPQAVGVSPGSRGHSMLLAAGVAVTVGSLLTSHLLLGSANRRYDDYLATPDPVEMDLLFRDTRRLDRWSNALLVVGELAAAATLVIAWHGPGDRPPAVQLSALPLRGGAAVRVAWTP
jgi:hypothetical protein